MIASASPSALLSHLPLLRDLAEQAPEDLADEWQIFIGALDALDQASTPGWRASDFKGGKPPAGLSAAEHKAIADAAGQVRPKMSSRRRPDRAAGTRRLQGELGSLTRLTVPRARGERAVNGQRVHERAQ